MRLGLLAPPWLPVPPPAYGGTEAVIDRLARGFVDEGHDVLLFTTGDATCPVPRASVLPLSEPARLGNSVVEQRHVAHAYEALRHCDLVHDHTVVGPFHAVRFAGLPVVTTNHGPFDADLLDLYRLASRDVSVIAISHHQASTAAGVPIAAVIHHGIDIPDGPPSRDAGYLLFLGRMAPDKGARRAAEIALAAGVPLKIAAKMREPLELDYFNEQVRPLLGDGVEFLGEVGTADKARLLTSARALINPIRWPEPFGLVMIEALAAGVPVLAFREGAGPEIVTDGDTGFLCDDEAAMVDAVGRLDTIDRARCRERARSHFSTQRMVRAHLELFERLLNEQREVPSAR